MVKTLSLWQFFFFLSLIFFSLVSFLTIREKAFLENSKMQFISYQEQLSMLARQSQSLLSEFTKELSQFSQLNSEFLTLPAYSLRIK